MIGLKQRALSSLSGRQRLALFVLLLVVLGVLVATWTTTLLNTIIVAAGVVVFLLVSYPIWLPSNYGTTRVRLVSLWVTLAVAGMTIGFGSKLEPLLVRVIEFLLGEDLFPAADSSLANDRVVVALTLAFVLFAVRAVNQLAGDKTAMGRHPDALDDEFPERDFKIRQRSFCNVLRTHLIDLNQRLNWSDAHFVPLDAEVEAHRGARTTRRHANLLRAIRADRTSQAFSF